MIKLTGSFQKKIFYNDTNSYLIGLFKVRKINDANKAYNNKTITITGYVPLLSIDETYTLEGEFKHHARYGEQFEISRYELVHPDDFDGIIAFLSSDLFAGIGVKTATKVVEVLGLNVLNDLLKDEPLINQVDISIKHRSTIINTLKAYQSSHQYIMKLTTLGFKLNDALLIYNEFKDNIENVLNDLYLVCLNIETFSFNKIYQIVNRHNLPYDNHTYQKVMVLETIKKLTTNAGNTYTLYQEVHNVLYRQLEEDVLTLIIQELIADFFVVVKDNNIWLYSTYQDELFIADYFKKSGNGTKLKKVDKFLDNDFLNHEQAKAIHNAFDYQYSIITGGPGTGKTTIVKYIVEIYLKLYGQKDWGLALVAPTGKASKRLSESASFSATTIHRFLKWDKEQDSFAINITNQADVKMVVVDELSMVDTSLMASLLRGIPGDAHVIVVGDHHQLPSIRPGQVLKDLIDADKLPVVSLSRIYRQHDGSDINVLASSIVEKNIDDIESLVGINYVDLNTDKIRTYIIEQLTSLLKKYTINDIAILIPKYATELGIDQINGYISNWLLPNANYIKYTDVIFKEKDKVLLINNMPDLNIFNGDIGYINRITDHHIYITFDDREHCFKPSELHNFKLGYATSIHKAQGSEYKVVMIIVNQYFAQMLDKELLYTAITRAKEKLFIVGDIALFKACLTKENNSQRKTYLKTLIGAK